jgi:conjugal transfer pilus assembly protein TraB
MKHYWENLNPKTKKYTAISLGAIVIFGIVALFSSSEKVERKTTREESIRHILTDTNTREVGIDALSADLKLVARENKRLKQDLQRFREEVSRGTENKKGGVSSHDIVRLENELERLKKQNEELVKDIKGSAKSTSNSTDKNTEPQMGFAKQPDKNGEIDASNPEELFKNNPIQDSSETDERGRNSKGQEQSTLVISSFSSSKNNVEQEEDEAKEEELYMPAGSIITGILINGMDAPTAQGARQDPFPATVRISKEAILPNKFRADVRECFLIVSGHGDLSSERAYLRGETLSCIRDNGDVIETGFNSYAVGEDGKAGVRGRLVSKQGQIIAKSLMAGFLSGAAEAFDVNAVPTLNLSNTGKTQYQQTDFSDTFVQGAAAKGASSALDRVAQFYVEMAEGIFPVIEIDAGRQIDIIVTKGSALNVRSSKVK